MSIKYEIDYSKIQALEDKMKQIPDNVERIINTYLHKEGIERTTKDITSFIQVSRPTNGKLKRHARNSKWSKDEQDNLGFTIKARGGAANKKGSYGYLVFPNEGRGPRNPLEQRFMERGLDRSTPPIIKGLSERLDAKIREEL